MKEYMPEKSMGSFVFHREKNRLEKEINMEIRRHWYSKTYWEQMEARLPQIQKREDQKKILSVKETFKAIKLICKLNGYSYKQFFKDVLDVVLKKVPKMNCLYICGESNSCKSTVAWSILNASPNVSQGMASTDFMYHNCMNASFIWFEELKITVDVVNELKRILEGSETCTNRKNSDGHYLPRTPVIACSNYEPWNFVPTEKETLLNRKRYYKFNKHEELKQYNKPFNPVVWKYVYDKYYDDKSSEPLFY